MLKQLEIRKANADDVDLIYQWTNDDLVRKQSFSSEPIAYDTHCEWFANKLIDKNSIIFILESHGVPVSIVRFDMDDQAATIGISIAKEFRGRGFAVTSINMGVEAYFKKHDLPILASIKPENMASIKSFEKTGFEFLKEEKINGLAGKTYQLKK